jgi:predicted MFS family arabinose efflux permease
VNNRGILLNIATKGSIAVYETLGVVFATSHFDMTAPDAGYLFATFGFFGVIALIYMKRICQYWDDVTLIVGGMTLMVLCNLLLLGPEKFSVWRFYVAIFCMYSTGYPVRRRDCWR